MKDAEDEAFDELAKKQGMWGGGFQAKRAAAINKINADFDKEYIKYRDAFPKEYTSPLQRKWIGLTPEETSGFTQHEMTVVKYVSKVLQEKNT